MSKRRLNYQIKGWHYYLLVFFLGIIPLFYQLGNPVLTLWDESRRAVNAYEMYDKGNLLVTHFNGEPDMWGTKPPLLIWLQSLSMHIFGVNEWAIRFPAALAGLLLGFLLLWFSRRYTESYLWGFISVLILYTSVGYINLHSVRTGDFDSLLVLFTTAASFLLFLAAEEIERKKKNRLIILFFIFLSLAALTKSIVAFIMAPAYLVFLIYRKELSAWFRNKNFYLGMFILVVLVGGFYFLRNVLNPGYIEAVIENEITGRYLDTLEQNKKPFHYYFSMLYRYGFKDWFYLVPIGIFLAYLGRNIKNKRLITYLILLTLSFLLVISISETK
ncbi:MAG: ArnT family glycosyltransferase, partial [Bacteroidota bacterium]